MTGRSAEVVETLHRRKIGVCCRLLMGDVIINGATRKKKRMHTPSPKLCKLREPSVRQKFAR